MRWITSGAFDKFYTRRVSIFAHLLMWFLLYTLHTVILITSFSESLIICQAFALRNVLAIAFCFYFIMYLVVPYFISKGRYIPGIILLVVPVFGYHVINYTCTWLISNYLEITVPSVRQVCNAVLADGIFGKAAYRRMVRGSWPFVSAVAPCIVAKLVLDIIRNITRTLRLEKDRLDMELNFLKSQLNPHFLFNTLNNIYMLSLKGAEQASDLILHLSEMMRYTLYDSDTPLVELQDDVAFLKNYTELERVRYGAKANIIFEYNEEEISDQLISPLLMFPFVENAFKYGHVGNDGQCHVTIRITADGPLLTMSVSNSKNSVNNVPKEVGGIGQANSRKRLELLYPGKHKLDIQDCADTYSVTLSLNLN
ncbi:Histidine kinase [Chitinophaga jiangningensis]|uniref:Histidine kinase n=1 Tax=Chitinophaga jiangningensis TaxID=1419482 RepID=A0A1M7FHY5_9BACT|nr:Histidine kinase [Chitinophaga jiangningensis]